jgi:aminoglycoside/choline kinase family phosphotransferase
MSLNSAICYLRIVLTLRTGLIVNFAIFQARFLNRRLQELRDWLQQVLGPNTPSIEPASADASFRRYFRIRSAGAVYIAMDAPPEQEDCRPFVEIAGYLAQMGLNAPRIIEQNVEQGFLLLTDLGSRQYLEVLQSNPDRAQGLYSDAIDALLRLQSEGRQFQSRLPPYSRELLAFELSLFHDWLCGRHLGIQFSAVEEAQWSATCEYLIDSARGQPRVFVHRDYHSRNLMVTEAGNPGLLDFQDAVEGPYTYDLVSLLKDCYVRWPQKMVDNWALSFYARLPVEIVAARNEQQFLHEFTLMGVQRHLKAAGIFARLWHRDGKPAYLDDVPATLSYVTAAAGSDGNLAFLDRLLKERCLPALENSA